MTRDLAFAEGLAAMLLSDSSVTYASPYEMVCMRRLPRKPRRPILQESQRGTWSKWLDSDGAVYLRRAEVRRVTWYAEQEPSYDPHAAEALLRRLDGEIECAR